MSNPKHARKRSGRMYVWPPDPEDGEEQSEFPSSTTLIGAGLPKPFLKWWAAKVVAEYAVDNTEAIDALDRDEAIDLVKRAHVRYTSGRARIGTEAHDAAEDFLRGEDRFEDYDPDADDAEALADNLDLGVYGYYTAVKSFLSEWDAEPLDEGIEATVYNPTRNYAGTADLFAEVTVPERAKHSLAGERVTAVVDWKSSKKIYPDVALQLASYAWAEFIGTDDGRVVDMPEFDLGIGVRLDESGIYEAVPLEISERVFASFVAVAHVGTWTRDLSKIVASPSFKGGDPIE